MVEQLGRSGLVSVEEDTAMQNMKQSKHFMQITWMDGTQWLRYSKYIEMD